MDQTTSSPIGIVGGNKVYDDREAMLASTISPLDEALMSLDSELAILNEAIESLAMHLKPVMVDMGTNAADKESTPEPARSSVVQNIVDKAARVRRARDAINYINQCVQV